jgi:hypothetical protein
LANNCWASNSSSSAPRKSFVDCPFAIPICGAPFFDSDAIGIVVPSQYGDNEGKLIGDFLSPEVKNVGEIWLKIF